MHAYQVGDLAFESNVAFPELSPAAGGRPEFVARFHAVAKDDPRPIHWHDHWRSAEGVAWVSFGKLGPVHVVRFPGRADFFVSFAGREIDAHADDGPGYETTRQLFLDRVAPLVLSGRRALVLHASAVAAGRGAVAFLGPSGRGKSTLATYLGCRGLRLLSDDYLVVEERAGELLAVPGRAEVRLREDSALSLLGDGRVRRDGSQVGEKTRLGLHEGPRGHCPAPVALKRLYLLSPPASGPGAPAVEITPLPQREAFIALVSNAFKVDVSDGDRLGEEFARLGRLVGRHAFYRLAYPRDFSLLPAVAGVILDDLGT